MVRASLGLVVSLALTGCADAGEPVAEDRAAKVVGENDLVPVASDGANVPARYRPLLDAFGLLRISPTNHCTVTHVGDGIALTAGHCVDDVPCAELTVAWGHRGGRAPYLVSRCAEVLAAEKSAARDYAILRVTPVPPAHVPAHASARPAPGTALTLFSYPSHRPLEWSQRCELAPITGASHVDEFAHACDTERASSGATLIDDATLTVIGIHGGAQGAANYGTFLAGTPLAALTPRR